MFLSRKDLQNRVIKSVRIFIDGFNDHASIDKWAKEGLMSIYKPGEQEFASDIGELKWANSWFYIFINRNPTNELSVELLVAFPKL